MRGQFPGGSGSGLPYQANRFRPLSEEDEMMERALEELMEEVEDVVI